MDIVFVERVDQAFGIGIVFVEDGLAHGVPPEPVLDDVVERDVQVAVFLRDGEKFLLRVVAVLALPVAVSPFAEEWRGAGEFAIVGDEAVEVGAIEKVIVHRVGNFGA